MFGAHQKVPLPRMLLVISMTIDRDEWSATPKWWAVCFTSFRWGMSVGDISPLSRRPLFFESLDLKVYSVLKVNSVSERVHYFFIFQKTLNNFSGFLVRVCFVALEVLVVVDGAVVVTVRGTRPRRWEDILMVHIQQGCRCLMCMVGIIGRVVFPDYCLCFFFSFSYLTVSDVWTCYCDLAQTVIFVSCYVGFCLVMMVLVT